MNLIEQAARRLEELRNSGIEAPKAGAARPAVVEAHPESTPDRLIRRLEEARRASEPAAHRPSSAPRPAGTVLRNVAAPAARSSEVLIDLDRLGAMGYLRPDEPRALVSDEFRVIKRPLLTNINGGSAAPVERANLVMVTSAMPEEGKTFVAINLAISMAMELDKHVLLVDADVSRPSVLNRLGLPPTRGLLDILASPDTHHLPDVILRTNIPKLSLLPAGAPRGQATELLASESMQQLLDELASRYPDRIIVFDAPPLLPSTESRVLATRMGQVILVVEAGRTPQKTVMSAMSMLESCPVVMSLLNKTNKSEVGGYYGYYGPVEA